MYHHRSVTSSNAYVGELKSREPKMRAAPSRAANEGGDQSSNERIRRLCLCRRLYARHSQTGNAVCHIHHRCDTCLFSAATIWALEHYFHDFTRGCSFNDK